MAATSSDASVIREASTEPAQFATIFDRHYDAIRNYLSRRLPASLAEELAADTFLVAFERRRDYDLNYASARPWLFGIATKLVSRRRRDERRRMAAYARSLPSAPEDGADEIATRADASEARAAIGRAIADLEPDDRDTMLLFALADLSYPEIALALRVPVGTVKSRLHRARKQLAAVLEPEGVGPNG